MPAQLIRVRTGGTPVPRFLLVETLEGEPAGEEGRMVILGRAGKDDAPKRGLPPTNPNRTSLLTPVLLFGPVR